MSRFLIVLFALVLLGCAYAAPSEENKTEVAEKTEKKTTDRAAEGAEVSTLETYLGSQGSTVVLLSAGTLLLIGGLALAFYYFYYLTYYGQSGNLDTYSGYTPTSPTYNYGGYSGQYYPNAARSLGGANTFNFARVLDMIAMAQETYEKFDFQSLDCQKKALCDLQQKQAEFGETGRKISSTFSFMDALEGLPMPTIIQTYLKEYKEAIMQGKNSSKECASIYPKCGFSIKEVFVKYTKRSKA